MKILITGANGYIGKSLTNALKSEHEVTPLTRQTVDLTNSDQVKEYFKNKYFDVVIHCAIEGGYRLEKDGPEVIDSNLKMYYNLLDNKDHFNKLFHFGSGAEKQDTFYGLSKKVINESIQNKDNFHNIRIFAVFDENEVDARFVKTNIRKYINREDIEIFINKHMDFFYMEDFITLIKYCITANNLPKTIECSYGSNTTLYDIAEVINNLDNHKVSVKINNWKFGEPFNGSFTDLGLNYVGLEQGIKNVYNKLKNEY
jgi:UDP-glucose 4-epimerase